MKRKLSAIISVLFLVILTQHSALAQKSAHAATRVRFARGATKTVVTGHLRNFKGHTAFVVRVRKGQTLEVNQAGGGKGAVSLGILSPSGEDVTDGEANCNNNKRIKDTAAGDYRIEVSECMKADAWRGAFRLKLTVK